MGGSGKKVKDLDKPKESAAAGEEQQKKDKPKRVEKQADKFSLVRVCGTDLNGEKPTQIAILGIKGISWTISNAVCVIGGFDPHQQIKELDEKQIAKMEEIIKSPLKFGLPSFLINRRADMDTGADMHLTGSDVDVATRFDVQRQIDLKTYKGWRHMMGQPVRGQRTRSKFRAKGRVVGVLKKSVKIAAGGAAAAPAAGAAPAKKEEKK